MINFIYNHLMGCGISARGPSSPLYSNEFAPPSHELVAGVLEYPENFPPSGLIKHEQGFFFNDREFIKQCQIIHLNQITVFIGKYITGIEISYFIDGNLKIAKHCSNPNGSKMIMPIQVTDSIICCEITYQNDKIHSIKFRTLENRVLDAVCTSGLGKEKANVNLMQDRRAIVAFKGFFGEYLYALSCYSWKICGKQRK